MDSLAHWIVANEGSAMAHRLALVLAVLAAVLHAVFGAIQKGNQNPWLVRGSIDVWLVIFGLPIALILVPFPNAYEWKLLAGATVIHFFYKLFMGLAYQRGDYTVVYPVVRGGGVLFTVAGAYLVFGEVFNLFQWVGVAVLLIGILGLAGYNLRTLAQDKSVMLAAMGAAVITGAFVAIYTTYDAFGIRASRAPFTFLVWFFVVTSVDIPWIALWVYRRLENPPPLRPLMIRGAIGAWIAMGSFGSIMMATRLDKVGEAAVLRETSTIFAAIIGWVFLKETVGPRRAGLMCLIALGAVIVELAG